MNVVSKKIFPSNPATYNSIGSFTQQPRSIYSVGDRPLCSVDPRQGAVKRFPEVSLATNMASLPLSWSNTRGQKLSKIKSMVKDIMEGIMHCNTQGSKTEEERFKQRIKAKEKTAKFHIYVQDALGGANPTVWEVARSTQTVNSPTAFGDVRVDDLVTAEPDPGSEKLGRTQGIITYSDMTEPALTMNLTFYFTGGEYMGNSITIGGRNPVNNKDREMPIVGGTGMFRMARGYVISNTYSFDAVTNYGVLEYTFFVAYPDQDEI
ncbi:dirigent protein 23-like isoform X2 [Henckelia pumila]|uniref:dirigent protein 23-like isoform X2 n=1 Tax=Henckelia pumila TaxID=405737 RepID=UPI003C6E56BA